VSSNNSHYRSLPCERIGVQFHFLEIRIVKLKCILEQKCFVCEILYGFLHGLTGTKNFSEISHEYSATPCKPQILQRLTTW
jgi:hypothetical protein